MQPRVSVYMSVYNGARFLPEAIDSVLDQTVSDFELIVVNDGSTDETADILERYRQLDPRVVVLSQSNHGIPYSANRAIAAARSELVAHLDADDRALPSWLERQLLFLEQHPESSVVSSHAYLVDAEGKRIGKSQNPVDVERGLAEFNPSLFLDVINSTVLMRKSHVLEIGGYREGLRYLEDRDFWGRLVTAGRLIRCNPELLVEYRVHSGSLTVKKRDELETMGGRGINLNIVRRLRGERELTPQEVKEWFESRPFLEKFKEMRRVSSGFYFRSASRYYADKQWLRLLWTLGIATLIRPVYVLRRAADKVMG